MHERTLTRTPNGKLRLTGACSVLLTPFSVEVTEREWKRWEEGDLLLQECFPNLSAGEREFVKTGISPDGWEAIFGPEPK